MPAELLLVNPRRKRKSRKTRAVKRRRVTAKRRRNKNPRGRRVMGYAVGPGKIRRRKMNPRARRITRRKRRSNPRVLSGLSVNSLKSALIPALIGGAGAVALDVALSYVPLPPALQSGYAKAGVKIVGALGLGFVAGKVIGKDKGRAVMAGALTVVAYSLVRDLLKQYAPTLPGLSDDLTDNQVGAYMNPAAMLGAYMPNNGLGAYIPNNNGIQTLQKMQMNGIDDGM